MDFVCFSASLAGLIAVKETYIITLAAIGSFAFSSDGSAEVNDDCCPVECCILGE